MMLFFAAENKLGFALLDAEELVNIGVYFVADVLARLQAHYHLLGGHYQDLGVGF